MSRKRVGVIRGGPSSEYVVSIKTGANVLSQLDKEKYIPIDILITPRGDWFMDGVRTDPSSASHHVDVFFNALHGEFGEDGKIQQLFRTLNIPHTGSSVIPSVMGMHKGLAKERFADVGIHTPKGEVVAKGDIGVDTVFRLFRNQHMPVIVKPVSGGSSVATKIVSTFDELTSAIEEASAYGDVLVEEYIKGKEATVCVVDSMTPGEHFVLHPIEIALAKENAIFDYDAKYSGSTLEICPGNFTLGTQATLRDLARKAHQAIGAEHYSRSDFIVTPDGKIYILEINTQPGLTADSLLPKALKAGNITFPHFLDHVIGLALSRK